MTSQGLFSIGGIASGLDTSSIIGQLLQLERLPVTKMQSTQAALRRTDDAWTQVNTRLSALRTATDALARPDRFASMVAVTSSNPEAVRVSTTTASGTGSLNFAVTALATAHQVGLSFGAADTPLAGEAVTVRLAGRDQVSVEVAGKTLDAVARELNAAQGGFTASVLKVADGDHRLVLTAADTGAANRLAVTSGTPQAVLQQAGDAIVTIGSGADAVAVSRASNTITDLVPGATVSLLRVTGGDPVTVTTARDLEGAVAAVKGYVDALNGAITHLKDATAYNAESRTGGALQGDAAARQLLMNLRSAATAPTGTPSAAVPGAFAVGMALDRDGRVTLDESKLRAALISDFAAVGQLFSRTGTATSNAAAAITGTAATAAGTYEVEVTRAAEVARVTGTAYVPPSADQPASFRVSSGGTTATVTLTAEHQDAAAAAAAIRRALAEGGLGGLTATVSDGALRVETTRFGAAAAFTIEGGTAEAPSADPAFGLAGTHRGTDVAGALRLQGTTDWIALTGTGRTLTAAAGAPSGLSFTFAGEPGAFALTYAPGLAGGMGRTLASAEGVEGLIARARAGISSQITIYQTRIDAFDQRLATRESTLRRQFTAMETALSSLNAQGSWLASQLAGLSNLSRQ